MGLRERCKEVVKFLRGEHEHDAVDFLMEFVLAETGRRHAGPKFEKALPIVIYCETEEERDEFIAAYKEARPNTITRKVL